MNELRPLSGSRVELRPLTADAVAAWIEGDRAAVGHLTGAVFPDPPVAPPLMDDALPFMRDRLREHPDEVGLWAWLCVLETTGEVVGSAGFGGRPDSDGLLVLGYAMYPGFAGMGYASETAALLAEWGLTQPGVRGIRVTAQTTNPASLRVAAKAGFVEVGKTDDPEVGELIVLERRS
ncbi:GNAT family N-acetyltransferase [Streptomyces monticola]|uniref:GNAT family N-acetyltransferase n=1 Tax=Streptomyces monticola TaxID=2666263 RepID=A0ABW2JQW7_9ACTN